MLAFCTNGYVAIDPNAVHVFKYVLEISQIYCADNISYFRVYAIV